ncbi:MAG: hypothetical protein AABW90_00555 [Nanoarchaeota archaeon]
MKYDENKTLFFPIEESNIAKKYTKRDLKILIKDDKILLHPATLKVLWDGGIKPRNLLELISYLQSFPTAIDIALNWKRGSAQNYYNSLKEKLKLYLSDDFLNLKPREISYGALPPSDYLIKRRLLK